MAGFSNQYPNLPGHLVEFRDGGMELRTDPNPPNTDSMLILGTAVDGPVMEPVALDINTVETIFGKDVKANGIPNGATLVPAFKQAWEAGCRDIRLMRVTGAVAQVTLKKAPTTINEEARYQEQLGIVDGNDLTTFTLQHKEIVTDTARVYAKGVLLSDGVLVNESLGQVSINAGVCDAGANLSVSYDYYRLEPVVDEPLLLNESLEVTPSFAIMGGIVIVKVGGITVDPSFVTVTGNVVKVTNYDADNVANIGDEITLSYTGITSDVIHAIETGNGTDSYITATSPQVYTLSLAPVAGSMHVYVNSAEVLTASSFSVDATAKTLSLKKELFTKGSQVTVSYYFNDVKTIEESIQLESYFGGTVYNQGIVDIIELKNEAGDVIGKVISITKPESKKGQVSDLPLSYSSIDYPSFAQLCDAINADTSNGLYKAKTNYPNSLITDIPVGKEHFIGGEDGIVADKNVIFKALSGERNSEGFLVKAGAYQLLEDYMVDWVVPVGIYANDELSGRYDNFAYELALFCAVLSYRNKTTLGGIAMKPIVDTSLAGVQEYARVLAEYNNFYLMRDLYGNIVKDSDGRAIDLGKFLSVVGGPEPVLNDATLGNYLGNPAVQYIAMNTGMQVQSAPTNKVVPGVKSLRFRFSNAQLDAITGNRIVTFKTKANRVGGGGEAVCCVDGMTASRIGSDYARLTTSKVIREVVDHVREVSDPFIGEPNTVEQKNALAATISKRLSILKERGVIVDYAFTIVITALDQVLGQAKIELTIVPPQELRKITTVVGLKATI